MKFIYLIIFTFLLAACGTEPQPLVIGKDECAYCKMPVGDAKFGAEIITTKGKLYKFDDIGCLIHYLKEGVRSNEKVKQILVVNYLNNKNLIKADGAVFLQSSSLRTPMNSGIIAFETLDDANLLLKEFPAEIKTWQQLANELN